MLTTSTSRWIFAPAFCLPLLLVACGWWVAPPLLWSDTATGMLAWRNFVAGGRWNTISEPSAINLALNTEQTVTWWSPGQYVPLGLLQSAGFSLGAGVLVLALLAAWSLTAGMVRLARTLGEPEASLPWIALAVAASWHTLYAFGMFIGGEVALIAMVPWVALLAWSLRHHPVRLIILLPPLFLLGSFAKHSFAIYALGLLAFLWQESLRGRAPTLRNWISGSWPLAAVGLVYLLGRHIVFPGGPGPADPGQINYTAAESVGFASLGPILAATGGGSFIGRIFMIFGLPAELGWQQYAPIIVWIVPLPLILYLALCRGYRALERLAGIIALTYVTVLALLLWRGGSISLDDRHFRPAGVLLLAALAGAAVHAARAWLRHAARACLILVIVFGIGAALQRHHFMRHSVYPSAGHISITDMPPAAQAELRRIDATAIGTDQVIYLPKPELSVLVHHARLIVNDAVTREAAWFASLSYKGRVSSLTLVLPAIFNRDGRGVAARNSFTDYPESCWTRRSVQGWDFWQASFLPPSSS